MGLHKHFDENELISDVKFDEDTEDRDSLESIEHKKQVRKMLEERLERKRLKEELEDEFDSDFNWDDYDN